MAQGSSNFHFKSSEIQAQVHFELDSKMRAIGTKSTRPSGEFFLPNTGKFADPPFSAADLQELEVEKPCVPENSRDLFVNIKAAGVNPLDFKERSRGTPIQG